MYTRSLCRKQSQMSKQNVWPAPGHLESLKSYCRATRALFSEVLAWNIGQHIETDQAGHNIEIHQIEQTTEETKQPKTETGANNKGFEDSTTNKQQKRRNNFTSSRGVQQHGLPWQLWRTTQKGEVLKWKQTWVHDQEGGEPAYVHILPGSSHCRVSPSLSNWCIARTRLTSILN